jgi:hypothetical protein
VIIATYEPAGKVPIGTFALPNPGAAELTRRERIAREGWLTVNGKMSRQQRSLEQCAVGHSRGRKISMEQGPLESVI